MRHFLYGSCLITGKKIVTSSQKFLLKHFSSIHSQRANRMSSGVRNPERKKPSAVTRDFLIEFTLPVDTLNHNRVWQDEITSSSEILK
jgi:hypothetical protein